MKIDRAKKILIKKYKPEYQSYILNHLAGDFAVEIAKKNISNRKLESYKQAEVIAREIRYQLSSSENHDANKLAELIIKWMKVTGNIKYERPL